MIRNFAYLSLILYILTFVLVPQTYAQSDGGDGVSGAGADNQSYDSGPTDSGPSDAGSDTDGGGGAGSGSGTGSGTTGSGEGTEGGGNEGSVSQSDVDQARSDQAAAWSELQAIENGTSDGDWGQALENYLTTSAVADSLESQLAAESRSEPVTEADVQAAQGTANSASEAHASAQNARDSALAAWNETKGTPEEFAAFNALLDANSKLEAAAQNLTAAEVAAANAAAAYSQTQSEAGRSSGAQDGKQTEVSAAGTSAISGGNNDLDSVISGSGLSSAGLSADRNAAVIGGWAQQLGIDPGQAAAYAAHFEAGRSGATVSSVSGSAAIAAQSAGGTSEQMAASAAAAAAMQVASTGGNPEQQTSASRDAGLATYTTSVNSSSMSADEKAASITAFGVANGNTVAQVAAAVSTTGADKDASIAGIATAFQSNGSTGSTQALTSLANGGWGTSPAQGAAATGAQTGGAAIGAPGAQQSAGAGQTAAGQAAAGGTPSQSGGNAAATAAVNSAVADPANQDANGKVTQAGLNNIVATAIQSGMSNTELVNMLNGTPGVTGAGISRAATEFGNANPGFTFSGGATAANYGNQAAQHYENINSSKQTGLPSVTTITGNGTTTSPAQAPAAAPAAPAAATAPDQNTTGLGRNTFDDRQAPTVDINAASWSYSTTDGRSVGVTVSNPNYTGTGSSYVAGDAGNITLSNGQTVPISNENKEAVQSLYSTVSSGGSPTPQQLDNVTKDVPISAFGGK